MENKSYVPDDYPIQKPNFIIHKVIYFWTRFLDPVRFNGPSLSVIWVRHGPKFWTPNMFDGLTSILVRVRSTLVQISLQYQSINRSR